MPVDTMPVCTLHYKVDTRVWRYEPAFLGSLFSEIKVSTDNTTIHKHTERTSTDFDAQIKRSESSIIISIITYYTIWPLE